MTKGRYVGQSVNGINKRSGQHKSDLKRQLSTRGLDLFHSTRAKYGFARAVFTGLIGLDHLAPTRGMRRGAEYLSFVLRDPNLNTQHQLASPNITVVID